VKGSAILLWLAQGFGSGRAPFAPGTFGSIVGVLWFLLLVVAGNVWVFSLGILAGLAASVWLCGEGEKLLLQKDPGSVVMDEIAAIPFCFAGWYALIFAKTGTLPTIEVFFGQHHWPMGIAVFILFRLFDIAKPWPVRQSQDLPGGWGVTIDDALAAVYVNAAVFIAYAIRPSLLL
jgi:phosphatidylglycerophosphatase A